MATPPSSSSATRTLPATRTTSAAGVLGGSTDLISGIRPSGGSELKAPGCVLAGDTSAPQQPHRGSACWATSTPSWSPVSLGSSCIRARPRPAPSARRARPATTRCCWWTAWSPACGTSGAPVAGSPSPSNHYERRGRTGGRGHGGHPDPDGRHRDGRAARLTHTEKDCLRPPYQPEPSRIYPAVTPVPTVLYVSGPASLRRVTRGREWPICCGNGPSPTGRPVIFTLCRVASAALDGVDGVPSRGVAPGWRTGRHRG
jgi:hypothetical protein